MTLSILHTALIREQTEPIAQRLDALMLVQQDINARQRAIDKKLDQIHALLGDSPVPTTPTPVDPPDVIPPVQPPPASPPVTPPAAGLGPIRAAYIGNDPKDADAHDRWLGDGRKTAVCVFTEGRDWVASSDISWWLKPGNGNPNWPATGRKIFWSIPLHPKNSNLEDVIAGKWDAYFRRIARQLADAYPGQPIHIRLGWEMNGSWFPWTIHGGRHELYKSAWRRAVGNFRTVDADFLFEWCTNQGTSGANPELAYPGDDVVDIIAQDFYWNNDDPRYDDTDPVKAFAAKLHQPHGLAWLAAFAAARGKPIAIPEWGVKGNNAGPYIAAFKAWMLTVPMVYHGLWDSDAAYTGRLSGNRWPATGAAYKAAFA